MNCVALSSGLLAGGCATPAARYESHALAAGLTAGEITGSGFRHRVYARRAADATHVRIYFGSDGSPWLRGRVVAADPTPRRPIELELLARDPLGTALLGRPCYHGFARDVGCAPGFWTDGRYGEAVVASLAAALRALVVAFPGARVTLVGYSGGGVLARLVAERVERVERVITVAANLDVAAWVALHGYLPLGRSLDPAAQPARGRHFEEIHLVGERDDNVPPSIVESYARRQPQARIERLPAFDHVCCWVDAWPGLLDRLDP